jgi:hypothetical protein
VERGVTTQALANLPFLARAARAKSEIRDAALMDYDQLEAAVDQECASLEAASRQS